MGRLEVLPQHVYLPLCIITKHAKLVICATEQPCLSEPVLALFLISTIMDIAVFARSCAAIAPREIPSISDSGKRMPMLYPVNRLHGAGWRSSMQRPQPHPQQAQHLVFGHGHGERRVCLQQPGCEGGSSTCGTSCMPVGHVHAS